jgi:hypothetical protein
MRFDKTKQRINFKPASPIGLSIKKEKKVNLSLCDKTKKATIQLKCFYSKVVFERDTQRKASGVVDIILIQL